MSTATGRQGSRGRARRAYPVLVHEERAVPDAAMAQADGYTGPRAELERALIQAAAEDHSTAPIMVAHVVKTAQAAVAESRALGTGPGSAEPIAAAARFLASPKRERFVYQTTLEAITTLRGIPKVESDQVRPA
jgi:hypothetical protein